MLQNIENKNIEKIKQFIKNNLWITPLIYIIGIITLLLRNKMFGLPFNAISFIQFSVIVVYLIIFLFMYSFIEFNFIALFELIHKKANYKFIKVIGHIMIFISYFCLITCFLTLLINDNLIAIKLSLIYFIFLPIILCFAYSEKIKITNIVIIIVFMTLIMEIPLSLGGFKGENVIYHNFNTNKKQNYTYYGNYDGLYHFVSENKVILIPIDSGYIEYIR